LSTRYESATCLEVERMNILRVTLLRTKVGHMKRKIWQKRLGIAAILCLVCVPYVSTSAGIKNMAVVVSAGSKMSDLGLADLAKLCKGTQKTWSDGKNFTLVIKDPESPDLRVAMQKLFGESGGDAKAAIAKVNESRPTVKIVSSDEDLLHTVEATPGAVGILDVYAINSSVKVLRIDGKLPFDAGYAFKGN
jgi:ABC-type phosphate transport system substrate-binding protein